MNNAEQPDAHTQALLTRMRVFCFPGGEDAARAVRGVKTRQVGEWRSSPESRWTRFTAEEFVNATRSEFRWDARIGSIVVTDAYEERHGRLAVKLGGVIPVKKAAGPEFDTGELQRYLASVIFCPPMLLKHPSLEWKTIGLSALRVRDREDPTGATVDLEIDAEGCPIACRADRPRIVGKRTVLTPWSAISSKYREWEGLRAASHLEVSWHLAAGPFTYFQGDITSFMVVR